MEQHHHHPSITSPLRPSGSAMGAAEQRKVSFMQLLQAVVDVAPSLQSHESCVTQEGQSRRGRKRKRGSARTRAEAPSESQRMSHIAVERNRRRLMNEHLATLRSLMPSSYTQRGDQASIVGGAIDYVKDLEQHLQALQARSRTGGAAKRHPLECFFISPQHYWQFTDENCEAEVGDRGIGATIEATIVQTHVSLRVLAPRRPGQLLQAVVALEGLHLVVLHLNVASFNGSTLYSFSLRIEEECKLISADEIARVVHHIFSYADQ